MSPVDAFSLIWWNADERTAFSCLPDLSNRLTARAIILPCGRPTAASSLRCVAPIILAFPLQSAVQVDAGLHQPDLAIMREPGRVTEEAIDLLGGLARRDELVAIPLHHDIAVPARSLDRQWDPVPALSHDQRTLTTKEPRCADQDLPFIAFRVDLHGDNAARRERRDPAGKPLVDGHYRRYERVHVE